MIRLTLLLPVLLAANAYAGTPVGQALHVTPREVVLRGKYAETRVLVDEDTKAGPRDASPHALFAIQDTRIAKVDGDTVRPAADGKTWLFVKALGVTVRVPLTVTGCTKSGPPQFLTDVVPVLTRAGCNAGACHGAASGKGGFKLSLLGYDPAADYQAITHAAAARRVERTAPEMSLILRKPTLAVAHRGGQRIRPDSPEYRLLRDWIAGGMPAPSPAEPRLAAVRVLPSVRTLSVGQTQRFAVLATYGSGLTRDVTAESVFTASDGAVARVSPDGEATVAGCGEGAVLVRYRGLVATARIVSPFGSPIARGNPPSQSAVQAGPAGVSDLIDRLVNAKLDTLGLTPSGRCADVEYLRRASLDVGGRLPTIDEVREFLADHSGDKRSRLVDRLLASSDYVDNWTLKWGDILRCSRQILSPKGMVALNDWIRRSVEDNKPWDQFARELILAQGSAYDNGPANYYRTANTPQELAETTSQVFLGVRIQCARCHNHPYEKWTQNQYYEMASFFARVHQRPGADKQERFVFADSRGEVVNPRTHKDAVPCALDAAPVPVSFEGDRRERLAAWLTSPSNPFFARCVVNRVWKHYMGVGFVEPVDDLRVTNPASNEPLLTALSANFATHGFDLKRLMRGIMLSQTYQRSADPTPRNARDTRFYSHYPLKRLEAEELMDAIASATGVPDKFDGYPLGTHADQLPDTTVPSYFLELFGRPGRSTACECERLDAPNLGQVLHLVNDKGLNDRIAAKDGRVARLIAANTPDGRIVQELFLASFSRPPTVAELGLETKCLRAAKNRSQAAQDLLWALLNSKEFLFNH